MTVDHDADVLVVGYGPVGQLLTVLLARKGWRVTVVERWPEPYRMPRAVAFDGESARILATAGLAGFIDDFGEPSGDYTWENAAGEQLLHFDAMAGLGRAGWPDSTSMYQPGLEAALMARGTELPAVTVVRGHQAVALTEVHDGVRLRTEGQQGGTLELSGRWVVGCDGANSFVRKQIGTTMTDLGFRHDWLICDVVLNPPRVFAPNNRQVCDPARPRTAVSAGPGHRRWEFMRVAGEPLEEFGSIENAWRLLELFDVRPDEATLERHAVYTFEARYAHRWRAGRLLIAGDAAHLMPPFAAQGMSSGFRDAANLAWKLHLVLAGQADESILDTYGEERRQHVQHAIGMSVELGRVICQTDPAAAADRDAMMLAVRRRGLAPRQPPSAVESLTGGLLQDADSRPPKAPVGHLVPQGRVARDGRTALFDDVVGTGFVLLGTAPPEELLTPVQMSYLEELDVRLVHLLPADAAHPTVPGPAAVDVDGVYLPYLAEMTAVAALVRPDFYLFGAAGSTGDVAALLLDLHDRLTAPEQVSTPASAVTA